MLDIKVVKQTKKEYKCSHCGKDIPKGTSCLYSSGTDYDNNFVSEHVHGIPENCFVDYLELIEFMDDEETIQGFRRQFMELVVQ